MTRQQRRSVWPCSDLVSLICLQMWSVRFWGALTSHLCFEFTTSYQISCGRCLYQMWTACYSVGYSHREEPVWGSVSWRWTLERKTEDRNASINSVRTQTRGIKQNEAGGHWTSLRLINLQTVWYKETDSLKLVDIWQVKGSLRVWHSCFRAHSKHLKPSQRASNTGSLCSRYSAARYSCMFIGVSAGCVLHYSYLIRPTGSQDAQTPTVFVCSKSTVRLSRLFSWTQSAGRATATTASSMNRIRAHQWHVMQKPSLTAVLTGQLMSVWCLPL